METVVFEHVLEADPRAPMSLQVPRVEKTLAIRFDEQRARIRRRVVHRDAVTESAPKRSGSPTGRRRRSVRRADAGKNTRSTSRTEIVPSLPYTGMAGCA